MGFIMAPVEFAGITDESRVRKPPGGETNDIFDLESRQQFQANQQHTQSFRYDEHRFRNVDHEIPSENATEYAGITDKTRVRKPPGGNTNDIFDLESRQRSQAMDKESNLNRLMKQLGQTPTKAHLKDQKGIISFPEAARPTYQLKSCQLNSNELDESSLYHLDKENINLFSDAGVVEEDTLKKKLTDEEDDSKLSTKKYLRRNPITGEESEVEVSVCSKLSECSNVAATPGRRQVEKNSGANRPCVRVRQPPGGVSSNIF